MTKSIAIIVAGILSVAVVANAQPNLALFASQTGDYVGQGQTYVTTNTADFTVQFSSFGAQQDVRVMAFGYSMTFGGPGGAPLAVGAYTNVAPFPVNGSSPGMNISGAGRACEHICGQFQILEIHADGGGNLDRLWMTYTQYCECGSAPLNGEIRFHSQLAPPLPAPQTLHVPDDYPSIQSAIDAASLIVVDTVLVAPGTYNESVQFNGKSAHLASEGGPSQTFLIAPTGQPAVIFGNGESSNSVVTGFTITNCTTGVAIPDGGAPCVVSNIIVNCGIGIDCDSGRSDIQASPLIQGNRIIGCPNGAVSLFFTWTPVIQYNLIEGNGGGIGMWSGGSATIYDNVIRENVGDGIGMVNYSSPDIVQNVIANNGGRGVYWLVPQGSRGPWLLNNTITGNGAAGISANGIDDGSEILNNIVVGNPAMEGGSPDVEFNDFYPTSSATAGLIGTAGNISVDPHFVFPTNNDYHLHLGSPCIDAGNNSFASSNLDLSQNPRITGGTIDLGAYEFQAMHFVDLNSQGAVAPYTSWATAAVNIQDAIDAAAEGDVILVTNGVYQSGGRVVFGALTNRVAVIKPMALESVNGAESTVIQGSGPAGDSAVRGVYLAGGGELLGFTVTNCATRADGDTVQEQSGAGVWSESTNSMLLGCVIGGNIANQSAGGVYQATAFNTLFLQNSASSGGGASFCILSNCTFSTNFAFFSGGGVYNSALTDCLLTNNVVSYPPLYWTTSGGGAYGSTLTRCLLVTNNAVAGAGAESSVLNDCVMLSNPGLYAAGADNCQLTNCIVALNTGEQGAGVFGSTAYNCIISGNSATYGAGAGYSTLIRCILETNFTFDGEVPGLGGGADNSTLYNCLLDRNRSSTSAGASASTLYNCTVVSNLTTLEGGAVDGCLVYNSIVYGNPTPDGTNFSNSTLTNCCTFPLPADGVGNITNAPLFVFPATNNFRLQAASPCINSGNNLFTSVGGDLDNNPRVNAGTVDIGAYEFQGATSLLSYAWAQHYGLPTDGSADFLDPDGDGMNNWKEWIAGTDPTNALSFLQMMPPSPSTNTSGMVVTWNSVFGKNYFIQRAANLTKNAFSTIQTNVPGSSGTTSYLDTTATNTGPYFYRVGVQ